jgi:hypothetical protein
MEYTYKNRRIIQHTDNHYDIEETRAVLAENGEIVGCVWAVIYCSEDEMARTLSGNLTGKAARLERQDQMSAALERSPFTIAFEKAYTSLIDVMGDEFFVWYDSPEFEGLTNGQMLVVMQGKLASFITEEDAAQVRALVDTVLPTEEYTDSWADERINDFQKKQIAQVFGKFEVTAGKEWKKLHLHATPEEQEEARQNWKNISGGTN